MLRDRLSRLSTAILSSTQASILDSVLYEIVASVRDLVGDRYGVITTMGAMGSRKTSPPPKEPGRRGTVVGVDTPAINEVKMAKQACSRARREHALGISPRTVRTGPATKPNQTHSLMPPCWLTMPFSPYKDNYRGIILLMPRRFSASHGSTRQPSS